MTAIAPTTTTGALPAGTARTGFSALGQADYIRLMVTQLQSQDPFEPVDNKEMLAQMAQFSALAGTSDMGETLKGIADKLDAILAAQNAALAAAQAAATAATPPA